MVLVVWKKKNKLKASGCGHAKAVHVQFFLHGLQHEKFAP